MLGIFKQRKEGNLLEDKRSKKEGYRGGERWKRRRRRRNPSSLASTKQIHSLLNHLNSLSYFSFKQTVQKGRRGIITKI